MNAPAFVFPPEVAELKTETVFTSEPFDAVAHERYLYREATRTLCGKLVAPGFFPRGWQFAQPCAECATEAANVDSDSDAEALAEARALLEADLEQALEDVSDAEADLSVAERKLGRARRALAEFEDKALCS